MYNIETIEIEVTTICNAYCPVCIRYRALDDGLFINPAARINQTLDPALIDTIFNSDKMSDNICVDLIGTSGEPLAHPCILDIVREILKYKPNAMINIHTNGGLKSKAFFIKAINISKIALKRLRTLIFFDR